MKKIKYVSFICAFIVSSFAYASETDPKKETDPKVQAEQQERVEKLEKRVYEIWEMDFSKMDKKEQTEVKQELKKIKKELKQTGLDNKISISIGAVIIIILLIIIIT